MGRQVLLHILFTFVVGLVAGVYLFFMGFAPTAQKVETAVEDLGQSLIVTGEAYGGCDRIQACPSFNVDDKGNYRYSYFPRDVDGSVLREGSLPLAFQRDLREYATAEALTEASQAFDPVMCDSYVDGIDVQYRIELEGEVFVLDSCGTTINADGALWQTLGDVWDYFQTSG